jgi:hypothetical protein
MKVALCFAGFIEELEDTKEFWNRIISKHDVDIYASFWKRNDNEVEEFIKLYNPKKIEVEDYSTFENTTQKLAANQIEPPGPPYALPNYLQERAKEFRQMPIWYKIWRSNLLAGSENYDVVIRARTDIKLDDNFELVQNDMLNIPIGTTLVNFWPDSHGFNDLFAFGPQDIMNYYSLLYIHLMDYVQRGHYAFPPEHMLAVHLSKTKIPIRFIPSYITISRKARGKENEVYNNFVGTLYEDIVWSDSLNFPINTEITFKKR